MKTDAIVVGAELDGQVAALRLLERGHSVRIFARGAGSLHYAPGGVHLLGFGPEGEGDPIDAPLEAMAALNDRHPYRLVGDSGVRQALDWFFATSRELGQRFTRNGRNTITLTPVGLGLPTYAPLSHQASREALSGAKVAVVRFRGHRDFPAGLIVAELRKLGVSVTPVELDPPEGQCETAALAGAFDRLPDPSEFFHEVAGDLAPGTELVLFPALLGLQGHARIMDAAAAFDFACLEVPTLPPSVPGLRLAGTLERQLRRGGAMIHHGARVTGDRNPDGHVALVRDERGRPFEASVFILASGGVLMGGLEVDSYGRIEEPVFGLDVDQTGPLEFARVDQTLDALHRTGVETDEHFRPRREGCSAHDNLFVTGGTLGHWNPMQEGSAEGVSIVTGWAAAEAAQAYLEVR
ncbi:MAG: anaerobic glycerol-3-phosphate dehydrogenase subunit GlpB [Alphaproteobacteria bacterium]